MLAEETIQGYSLSPQQKHLWDWQQLAVSEAELQQNTNFRAKCLVAISGHLDRDRLYASIQSICSRHEILRTTFQRHVGMQYPLQVVSENATFDWEIRDLQELNSEQQQAQIEQIANAPASPSENPLQVWLLPTSPEKYFLLLSLPALCADRTTFNILVAELSDLYATGGENILPELALSQAEARRPEPAEGSEIVQYSQVSQWQYEILSEFKAETGEAYWQPNHLERYSTPEIPKPETPKSQEGCDRYSLHLEPELVEKLERTAQHYDSSLEDWLFAAWQTLLWRIGGERPLLTCYGSDGRPYQDLDETMGLLAKWLPVPITLDGSWPFSETLEYVRDAQQQVLDWQDYVVAGATPLSSSNSLPVGFEFLEQPSISACSERSRTACSERSRTAANLTFEVQRIETTSERFGVCLSCHRHANGLDFVFHYQATTYAEATMARLSRQWQTLLEGTVEAPDRAIDRLPLLDDRDREQLLVEFNQTQRDFPSDKCLHQLFEEQVERCSDRVALQFEQEQLTYTELNQRANQLAHYLQQEFGVGPDTLVAIGLERSAHSIVALLGILKAGGAYVPVDPGMPQQRRQRMLAEANPVAIVTQQSLQNLWEEQEIPTICLDTKYTNSTDDSLSNPTRATLVLSSAEASDSLAYVIFTSGSSGQPKGVAVEHRQVLNYVYGISDRLSLPDGATYATVSTLAADLGNTAVFGALCSGGCLHILSGDRLADPQAFAEYCASHRIDCLKMTPSHLAALVADEASAQFPQCRHLILGGEPLRWELIPKIRHLAPDCQIWNHYGPTETTIGVLTYKVEEELTTPTVPLGRPLPNVETYLLDRYMQPVPLGVPGELYIGGASVAREYLHQPELTQQQFVKHPFRSEGRLYKTGDIARYLEGGNLEFLGRNDHQVKIRGFRIELAEVEAVVAQHSQVREVAVTTHQSDRGETELAAYIALKDQQADTVRQLREFVRERLPGYMVPATFSILNALPRTPSGKIDRQSLPEPMPETEETSSMAPRTQVETQLVEIWQEILQTDNIGIQANFFDLGGHSLLATQVMSRVRNAFGVEIPLRSLFESPTIADLAVLVEQALVEQVDETELSQWLAEIEADS